MRVWIEIMYFWLWINLIWFHPLMRVWIEIKGLLNAICEITVSPSYEGVD